jgi:hypothetical protein
MYPLMLMDCIVIIVIAALVYWPPFLLRYMSKEDLAVHAQIAKRVWLMPRYMLMQLWTFISGSVFMVAIIMHLLEIADPMTTDPVILSAALIAFVRVTMWHVFHDMVLYHRSAVKALVIDMLVMAMTVTLVVLYGVLYHWIAFGLMLAVAIMDLFSLFVLVNWYMIESTRMAKHLETTPMSSSHTGHGSALGSAILRVDIRGPAN